MKQKLNILKIGGNIIEYDLELQKFLKLFAAMKGHKILVHGGGKKASELLAKLGIEPKMDGGRRITDEPTLDVAIMVYGGLTNKKIVAKLQALDCNAMGMSGADANAIRAHKRPVVDIDYGFAGDVDSVDSKKLVKILGIGLTPVFCALTHDKKGQLLNTNADTIASALAIGLSPIFDTVLNYCFEFDGVLYNTKDPSSLIQNINSESYQNLVADGVISEGMLPKMHNCFHALQHGVTEVRIGNLGLFDTKTNIYTSLVL